MALLFQRLAQNFIKNGYYPTDEETMSRIVQALHFAGRKCKLLDPCCGEGTALAEIKHTLNGSDLPTVKVTSYGVEYNSERAWHSKQILDYCIHGDLRDCMIGARQFGLLFLNPPYGDAVSDKAQLSDPKAGKLRLEKEFYRRTNGLLQFGGVMILIIPYYSLDKEFSTWISRHFHDVKVFMAPEQQFKQCVIFAVRHKVTDQWATTDEYQQTRSHLVAVGHGDVVADESAVGEAVNVDNGSVLDIGVFAHGDFLFIAAQHAVEPHADPGCDLHIADDLGSLSDEGIVGDTWQFALIRQQIHLLNDVARTSSFRVRRTIFPTGFLGSASRKVTVLGTL